MRRRRSYALSRSFRKNPIGKDTGTIAFGVAGGILLAGGVKWLWDKLTTPSA
jgi:hypothetical protein